MLIIGAGLGTSIHLGVIVPIVIVVALLIVFGLPDLIF